MDEADIRARLEEAIDVLADIEHDRWAHWQRYMHQKGERRSDGSLVLPAELVKQWDRQISTPFAELSEALEDGREGAIFVLGGLLRLSIALIPVGVPSILFITFLVRRHRRRQEALADEQDA